MKILLNSKLSVESMDDTLRAEIPEVKQGEVFPIKQLCVGENRKYVNAFFRWVISSKEKPLLFKIRTKSDTSLNALVELIEGKIQIHFSKQEETTKHASVVRQAQFWNTLLNCFDDGILFVKPDGRIIEVSSLVPKLLNLVNEHAVLISKEALVGKNILELVNEEIAIKLQQFSLSAETNRARKFDERFAVRNGFVEIKGYPSYVNGVIDSLCLVVIDVTEQAATERALQATKDRSFEAAKWASIGQMAGGIAHEVNTPLSNILLNLNMLAVKTKNLPNSPSLMKRITSIEKTTYKIATIIATMRGLARDTSSGEIPKPTNMEQMINDILGLCSEKATINNIQLKVEVGPELQNIEVLIRKVQISQILVNLIQNAIDAVIKIEEKFVVISCNLVEDHLVFEVSDSGPTPSEEIRERIFQPFFTTKDVGAGTGLGLSISLAIAKSNGGKLRLKSKKKNTCFVLELPISEEAA